MLGEEAVNEVKAGNSSWLNESPVFEARSYDSV